MVWRGALALKSWKAIHLPRDWKKQGDGLVQGVTNPFVHNKFLRLLKYSTARLLVGLCSLAAQEDLPPAGPDLQPLRGAPGGTPGHP